METKASHFHMQINTLDLFPGVWEEIAIQWERSGVNPGLPKKLPDEAMFLVHRPLKKGFSAFDVT